MSKNPRQKLFLTLAILVGVCFVSGLAFSNTAFAGVAAGVAGSNNTSKVTTTPYSCGITTIATCIVYFISYLVSYIAGFFVSFAIWMVQLGLQFNQHVFDSPIVQTGFGLTLAVANLGFVLGIIIIAIATILRQESYGIKQVLWKLVVMAILVNFGLVIASPIVGFADSMTNYFLKGLGDGTAKGFANVLTGDFSAQNLIQPPPKASNNVGSSTFMQSVMSLLFDAFFSFVIIVSLLALAVLLLVRYVYLGMLLIGLPFAWLAWIFPKYSGEFSKWWDNFIKWTFFPAAALFFIYLAILTASNATYQQSASISSTNLSATSQDGTDPTAAMAQTMNNGGANGQRSVIQVIADDVLLCALMLGGLFAAASFTGKAGAFVTGQAKSASSAVGGYMKKKAKNRVASVGRNIGDRTRSLGKQYDPGSRQTTTGLQRFGSRLQNVPGFKGAGTRIANLTAPDVIKKDNEKGIQDYADNNLRSLTNEGVLARAKSRTALVNPTQAAALAQELAKRNLTDQIDPKRMNDFVNAADRLGNIEKVTANRPDLMPPRQKKDPVTGVVTMETKEEAIARAITSAKAEIIQTDAKTFDLAHPPTYMTPSQVRSAVAALSPSQLGAIGNEGNRTKQNNLTEAVKTMIAGFKIPSTTTPGKFELDVTALNTAAAAPGADPNLKNLEKIVKHMESSPNWGSVLN